MLLLGGGDCLLTALDPRNASRLIQTLMPTCERPQQAAHVDRCEQSRLFLGLKHGFRDD